MRSTSISIGLAAIIGIVIGLLLQSPQTPAPKTAANNSSDNTAAQQTLPLEPPAAELDEIRQQLTREVEERKKLQAQVEKLGEILAQLNEQAPPESSSNKAQHSTTPTNIEPRPWFNEQALLDAGIDQELAKDLKVRYETQELEKLYLRDKATREGWFGNRRYREELQKLDNQLSGLQKELGEESYSAYLYATGQANRVTVQSVLAKSSADIAGIRSNDQITRYNNQKIYNWRDLRNATTQGDINETIAVEIIRNGKPMEIYVQRGPLGIRMSSVSVAP